MVCPRCDEFGNPCDKCKLEEDYEGDYDEVEEIKGKNKK